MKTPGFKPFKGLIVAPVGNNRKNNLSDVMQVKSHLESLGYMEPEKQPHGYITREIEDITPWDRFKSSFGAGTWGGLENSWGEDRIWINPADKTNVYGRSGFTIHGGAVPGSAGCIDLTNEMPDFIKKFKKINKDLKLKVCYPRP